MTTNYKVGLVVNQNYANRIMQFAYSFDMWVVESPQNMPAVERIWATEGLNSDSDPLDAEITTFQARDGESAQALCARIAGDVDEHHGEFAHDPPWSEIEVYGAKLDDCLREIFSELGATSFEETTEGFICRR